MKFVKPYKLDTGIDWWDENRKKLNKVIKHYNDWLIDGAECKASAELILRECDWLRQVLDNISESYLEDIVTMEEEIREHLH